MSSTSRMATATPAISPTSTTIGVGGSVVLGVEVVSEVSTVAVAKEGVVAGGSVVVTASSTAKRYS